MAVQHNDASTGRRAAMRPDGALRNPDWRTWLKTRLQGEGGMSRLRACLKELRRRKLVGRGAAVTRLDAEAMPEWFHAGQAEAWGREEETVLLLCGRQAGKTVFGPWWLLREIQRRGPGDYAIVGPSLELLKKKALPYFRLVFGNRLQLGTYHTGDRQFRFSEVGLMRLFGCCDEPCTIFVGYAAKPESLESATYKAVWADEAGQPDFKSASWDALVGRRAVHRGRILLTTTPYNWGWLKSRIYDAWEAGANWVGLTRFESWMNPEFGREQFELIRARMEGWKFDLFYRAQFTKPAGMIYDCYDRKRNETRRFTIPDAWPRYIGLDFGNVNTAAVFGAKDPATGTLYIYRSYHSGGLQAAGHVENLLLGEPGAPMATGGAPSEDEWRTRYGEAGLPVLRPDVADVEVGIEAVYAALNAGRLVFFDDLSLLISEVTTYSRELNGADEPTKAIQDKHSKHRCDALRYLVLGQGVDDAPAVVRRGREKDDDEFEADLRELHAGAGGETSRSRTRIFHRGGKRVAGAKRAP